MEQLQDLRDSTFINLATSVDKMQKALQTPKKRGVRGANHGTGGAEQELKDDMVTVITSPLSQLENAEPITGLSGAQIEALRALYTVLNDEMRTDEALENAVFAAVKQLNPNITLKTQEEDEPDGDNDSTTGLPSMVPKSERLAQLPQKSYDEDAGNALEDLLREVDEGDDEGDDEEMADQEAQLDEEGNEAMDGVETAA